MNDLKDFFSIVGTSTKNKCQCGRTILPKDTDIQRNDILACDNCFEVYVATEIEIKKQNELMLKALIDSPITKND